MVVMRFSTESSVNPIFTKPGMVSLVGTWMMLVIGWRWSQVCGAEFPIVGEFSNLRVATSLMLVEIF
jgi:hypothetical protein